MYKSFNGRSCCQNNGGLYNILQMSEQWLFEITCKISLRSTCYYKSSLNIYAKVMCTLAIKINKQPEATIC